MGNKVLMDSDMISETGAGTIVSSQNLSDLKGEFYSTVEQLVTDAWSGADDSVEFNNVARDLEPDLLRAIEIIEEVGQDLQKTASGFDDMVAGNKSRLGQV